MGVFIVPELKSLCGLSRLPIRRVKVKKKNIICSGLTGVLLVIGFVLAGCASASPYVNTLMDPAVPAHDHAVVYFHPHVHGVVIDGDDAKKSKSTSDEAIVMVTPGMHTVSAMYADVDATRQITSDYMSFTHDFTAGHFYYVYPARSGTLRDRVGFEIIDEADPAAMKMDNAESRVIRMQKFRDAARYPSKTALAVTYWNMLNEAAGAESTPFEGEWELQNDSIFAIGSGNARFRGKTYQLHLPVLGKPNVTTNGTFEFTENTITLTELKSTDAGFLGVFLFLKNIKSPKKIVYTYSFASSNELILSQGNKKAGTFVKRK